MSKKAEPFITPELKKLIRAANFTPAERRLFSPAAKIKPRVNHRRRDK